MVTMNAAGSMNAVGTIPELEVDGQEITGFVFILCRLWDNLQAHFSMGLRFAQIGQAREKQVVEVPSVSLFP
jgi:hypothetical protein